MAPVAGSTWLNSPRLLSYEWDSDLLEEEEDGNKDGDGVGGWGMEVNAQATTNAAAHAALVATLAATDSSAAVLGAAQTVLAASKAAVTAATAATATATTLSKRSGTSGGSSSSSSCVAATLSLPAAPALTAAPALRLLPALTAEQQLSHAALHRHLQVGRVAQTNCTVITNSHTRLYCTILYNIVYIVLFVNCIVQYTIV